jgi:hypothetical protein
MGRGLRMDNSQLLVQVKRVCATAALKGAIRDPPRQCSRDNIQALLGFRSETTLGQGFAAGDARASKYAHLAEAAPPTTEMAGFCDGRRNR